jgi:hypothetical protein
MTEADIMSQLASIAMATRMGPTNVQWALSKTVVSKLSKPVRTRR